MTALHTAAQVGLVESCELLHRAHVVLGLRDHDEWTPLMHAAYTGRLDIVRVLLRREANVNTVDSEGMTPHHARKSAEASGRSEVPSQS
jgi:ankyrin repeat protein